ncbi:hypothetical protein K0M31_000761 [Melipona bicolor]|uniref:Uncharacterized protein n=1 Tax=Melipona bicolor TaxID=60889 RepID=A0AA40GE65_9HYME|nr:hypothetical protein K0M31_000761 [Melipona bicolor]
MPFNDGRKWNDAETRGQDFCGNILKSSLVVRWERNHENGCGRRGDATGRREKGEMLNGARFFKQTHGGWIASDPLAFSAVSCWCAGRKTSRW